ncbi:MAG: twin-arginine translocase TatA/TatE family subunit, partial [Nitrospirae bacterium]|nr:twin-arginine translocase TatA/TatE family subunit [Nitrospirota bacterium]
MMNEWVIVGVVAVIVLFGVSKLPEIGRGVGEAIKNFKKAVSGPSEIDVTPKKKTEEKEEEKE